MNTQPLHYATLDDGGLSETMRRIETMIRKHAPMLLKLPDNYSRQPTKLLTTEQKIEIVHLLNSGLNAYQVAKQLGLNDRAVRYYRRYANKPVRGDGETRQATAKSVAVEIAPSGGSILGCARAAMSGGEAQQNRSPSIT